MALPTYTKDPQAKLDYGFDWTDWLAGDTIAASTWVSAPAGLTLTSPTFSNTHTTVWIAGGAVGVSYTVTNHITTALSPAREDDRSFRLKVKER